MSSYHASFSYKDKNSFDEGYIIVAFEPDNGFKDTYLSMENVSDDYYDNTKRFDYGAKYTSQSEVSITLIKKDGTGMSVKDFRSCAKWLTGARTNSWLDMSISESRNEYIGDGTTREFQLLNMYGKPFFGFIMVSINGSRIQEFAYDYTSGLLSLDNVPEIDSKIEIVVIPSIYSFLGKFTNIEQYKMDARTIGIKLTFSSISPWAFSAPQTFNCGIGQALDILQDDNDVIVFKKTESSMPLGVDVNGVLVASSMDADSYFMVTEAGVAYIDTSYKTNINNMSDDLYTYIDLDIDYINQNSTEVYIKNETLGEETVIKGIDIDEIISISAKQFIVSYNVNQHGERVLNIHKIFGDDFKFVWPRLAPGVNKFTVMGNGSGTALFTYRYPMKVGDCAMDIDVNGDVIYCDDYNDYLMIDWNKIANTPTTLSGYGIADAYTAMQVDNIIENIEISSDNVSTSIDKEDLDNMLAEILG